MRLLEKSINIILIFLLVISLCSICYCSYDWHDRLDNVTSQGADENITDSFTNVAKSVITITQVIGVGVAVIMLIVLGMKYMTASVGERAEIKKHLVIYVVGAVVLFAASGILEIIKRFSDMVNEE